MCGEKVAEKFLKLLLSVPEFITQTVVSKVLRTSRLQRAAFEMLFWICRNRFQPFKGTVMRWTVYRHRHYLETLGQRFSRGRGAAVTVEMLSWLVCPSGRVSIWKAPCWLTDRASSSGRSRCLTLLLLMKIIPLPSMGKGMWVWKSCRQSRGGQKGEFVTLQWLCHFILKKKGIEICGSI